MNPIRDRLWKKAAQNRTPLSCALELLPVCNLACKMCYVRKSMSEVQAMGGLMSGSRWLELVRQAKELGLLFPLITGGEPFLHPDFKEIMQGLLDMGMQVSINTNGTLIDEELAEWLSRHRPLRLNLTLYGASRETYRELCGDASAFDRVREGVRLLKKYNVPVKFNASITPQNVQDLDALIAYAKEVDSPIQVATYMFPPVRRSSELVGQNDRLSPEEAGLARVRADFLQNEPAWFLGQAKNFSRFVPLEEAIPQAEAAESEGMGMVCRAGICSFWIDWQGNLVNCGMYGSVKHSLKDRPLAEVWEQLVEDTLQVRYAPICAACPNRVLCHTCIAMIHNECGTNAGRPDYLCRMNAAAARYYVEYAKLLPEENAAEVEPAFADPCDL